MVKYPESTIDRTFSALADPIRRQILQRLKDAPGLSVTELTAPLPIKMPGMMKHLGVLADAGLISRTKNGRVVSVRLEARPMREAVEWLHQYRQFWTVSLDRLATLVEDDDDD